MSLQKQHDFLQLLNRLPFMFNTRLNPTSNISINHLIHFCINYRKINQRLLVLILELSVNKILSVHPAWKSLVVLSLVTWWPPKFLHIILSTTAWKKKWVTFVTASIYIMDSPIILNIWVFNYLLDAQLVFVPSAIFKASLRPAQHSTYKTSNSIFCDCCMNVRSCVHCSVL